MEQSDVMNAYAEAAAAPLGDNLLAQISATANQILDERAELLRAEEAVANRKQELRRLEEEVMPELMDKAGQEKITTRDGVEVAIRDMIRASIPKARQPEAFAWLRGRGSGGIIKTAIEARLGRGQDELLEKAVQALDGIGLQVGASSSVHPQTLAALIRELLAKGEPVDLQLLGAHCWRQAVVTTKAKAPSPI